MNNKNLKMELLNSEKMHNLIGGAGCTKKGDTIFQECLGNLDVTIVLCTTYEATCKSGFSNNCPSNYISCPTQFITNPKP
jgi:hypothetical protein